MIKTSDLKKKKNDESSNCVYNPWTLVNCLCDQWLTGSYFFSIDLAFAKKKKKMSVASLVWSQMEKDSKTGHSKRCHDSKEWTNDFHHGDPHIWNKQQKRQSCWLHVVASAWIRQSSQPTTGIGCLWKQDKGTKEWKIETFVGIV